jgi:hypothetical protein
MSLLTIIQDVTVRLGLTKPGSAFSSSDPQIQQLIGLLNEEGSALQNRCRWQTLQTEATFTTLAAQLQGNINTIAPGFIDIINDTIWNRSLRRPVFGPLTPPQWQQIQAQTLQGPWNQFRIRNNQLLVIPAPIAGQNCFFEFNSKNWVTDNQSVKWDHFTADDNTVAFDEEVMKLGLRWRWRAEKGFEYAQIFDDYERRVNDLIARDSGKQRLNASGNSFDLYPGIVVASGSWSLP